MISLYAGPVFLRQYASSCSMQLQGVNHCWSEEEEGIFSLACPIVHSCKLVWFTWPLPVATRVMSTQDSNMGLPGSEPAP